MTLLRELVVNADDLGLTVGVNDGIFDAHEHGILTSASLFANAPATADAIRRARSHPALGLGAHLTLVDGTPLLPPRRIPTLTTEDGRFRRSWKPFMVACLRGTVSLPEIERELTAQIERLIEAGVTLTHLDAHKHVHAYPPVFEIVARLAGRFGVPVVRVPYERRLRVHTRGRARRIAQRQAFLNAVMWPWARRNARTAAALGLRTPHFIGRVHTGVLNAATLQQLLRETTGGVTELMVHPGYPDADLSATGTRLLASRETELDLLCRLDTRALLVGEGIDLVRHDLSHVSRRSFRHVS
jgi:hopanoid biosynthesis associated protein HpnK